MSGSMRDDPQGTMTPTGTIRVERPGIEAEFLSPLFPAPMVSQETALSVRIIS